MKATILAALSLALFLSACGSRTVNSGTGTATPPNPDQCEEKDVRDC